MQRKSLLAVLALSLCLLAVAGVPVLACSGTFDKYPRMAIAIVGQANQSGLLALDIQSAVDPGRSLLRGEVFVQEGQQGGAIAAQFADSLRESLREQGGPFTAATVESESPDGELGTLTIFGAEPAPHSCAFAVDGQSVGVLQKGEVEALTLGDLGLTASIVQPAIVPSVSAITMSALFVLFALVGTIILFRQRKGVGAVIASK